MKNEIRSSIYDTPIRRKSSNNLERKESLSQEKLMKYYETLMQRIKLEYSHIKIPYGLSLSDEIYSKELKCAFCENIANESKMCIECDCLICNHCQVNITSNILQINCINCKKKLKLKNLSKIKSKIFENLIVSCPSNFDFEKNEKREIRVCSDIIVYRDILVHLENCKNFEKVFECRNCKFTSQLSNLRIHLIQKECNQYLNRENSSKLKISPIKNEEDKNQSSSKKLTFDDLGKVIKLNSDFPEDKDLRKMESNFHSRIFKLENSFENIQGTFKSKIYLIKKIK